MKIIDNFKNLIEKAKKLNEKQINYWKYFLFFIIIVDIIGIYWYLHLKKLGIALLVVSLIALGLILFLESKLPPKINKKEQKKTKKINKDNEKPKEIEESKESNEDTGFSLPSAEEYNERMNKAFKFEGF